MADLPTPRVGGQDAAAPEPGFVRPARLIDAEAFAHVQLRAWQVSSDELGLPPPPDQAPVERAWEHSITAPPTDRHRTWVATAGHGESEQVVGVAAISPASDPDLDAEQCVELALLAVDPDARRQGHGSRLLTAALQTASDAGEREAVVWVPSPDDVLRVFLEGAGWVADGAFRTLADTDPGTDTDPAADDATTSTELRQVRLSTSLVDS